MSDALEAGLTIIQTQTGVQDSMKSNDPAEILNNLAQMAAGLSDLAAKVSPIGMIATNLGAALVTIEKMQLDAQSGQSPSLEDCLSLMGDAAAVAIGLGIMVTPIGEFSTAIAMGASLIGGAQINNRGQTTVFC